MHEDKETNTLQTYCVIKAHTAVYPDPITMQVGDIIDVSDKEDDWQGWTWVWCTNQGGKSGWVPKGYVIQDEGVWRARYDYSAMELSVEIGERVEVLQRESGWVECTNDRGARGWVPAENVDACYYLEV
jgi:uncharacterized protein YgiM (DUF1202 family)